MEWTKSDPAFLLGLLDAFQIEGRQEIKDLFFKVGDLENSRLILWDRTGGEGGGGRPIYILRPYKRDVGARRTF